MCEPVTLASLGGAVAKANASAMAGRMNSIIDLQNAHTADVAAGDARDRGQTAAGNSLLREGSQISAEKNQITGAGVDVNKGSPLDVLADASMFSHLDARVIQNNAAREAWGFEKQGYNFRQKSVLDQETGDANSTADYMNGASTAVQLGMKVIPVTG